MGKKTVWVLDERDKAQIKNYSEEITKICKLNGYDPENDNFEDYFDSTDDFDFIPCIKEGKENIDGDEEIEDFWEDVSIAIDEAYDPNIEVTLEEVKKQAAKERSGLADFIYSMLEGSYRYPEDIIHWILNNSDNNTIQRFINWAIG